MNNCPYCGSKHGVYTTYTGRQYYNWNGELAGYDTDETEDQRFFARCVQCNKKISLQRILKDKNNSN